MSKSKVQDWMYTIHGELYESPWQGTYVEAAEHAATLASAFRAPVSYWQDSNGGGLVKIVQPPEAP